MVFSQVARDIARDIKDVIPKLLPEKALSNGRCDK